MTTQELSALAAEIAEQRTHEVWVIGQGYSFAVKNMTQEDANDVYIEFVRQCKQHEGWNHVDMNRWPDNLSRLQRGSELMIVGVIDTAFKPQQPYMHWLTGVPERAQS